MLATRFPDKVNSLVLAGSPIDTDAGDGPIKRMVHEHPISFYQELVEMGGGLMKGKFMLQGWKNLHPAQHYIQDHVDLYEHIDDPVYVSKEETFASWHENPIDLSGRWYLQATQQLFVENRLAKGKFIGLGRKLDLGTITCPAYLMAGADDDIITPEQVLNAANAIGQQIHGAGPTIPAAGIGPERIRKIGIPGGHMHAVGNISNRHLGHRPARKKGGEQRPADFAV
jgi:poly(3-hydroxyalkanoate) synthetase